MPHEAYIKPAAAKLEERTDGEIVHERNAEDTAQDGRCASPLAEKADNSQGSFVLYAMNFEVRTCINQNRPH